MNPKLFDHPLAFFGVFGLPEIIILALVILPALIGGIVWLVISLTSKKP